MRKHKYFGLCEGAFLKVNDLNESIANSIRSIRHNNKALKILDDRIIKRDKALYVRSDYKEPMKHMKNKLKLEELYFALREKYSNNKLGKLFHKSCGISHHALNGYLHSFRLNLPKRNEILIEQMQKLKDEL